MIIPGVMASAASGGGGGGYVASAVNWDGATLMENLAIISATTTAYSAVSVWLKLAQDAYDQQYQIVGVNPVDGSAQFQFYTGSAGGNNFKATMDMRVAGTPYGVEIDTTPGAGPVDTWFNLRFDFDTLLQTGHAFVGGTDVTGTVTPRNTGLTAAFSGMSIGVPDTSSDDFPMVGDMADFCYFISNSAIDMSLSGQGALFNIAGAPANPTGFPPSLILFSGDHTTFPVNQGTGGAFTLTGSLTDASTSPSD